MPRIDATTVAEHHQRRRRALLDAGMALLAQTGVDGVTPAAVGAAAGLARSSVYQYFDSSAALLAALVEDAFPRSIARLRRALEGAATPQERIETYLSASLSLAADASYTALHTLARADVPAPRRDRLAELHRQLYAPLVEAVRELVPIDPELVTRLLLGLLGAAVQEVRAGAPAAVVESRMLDLVRSGLKGA